MKPRPTSLQDCDTILIDSGGTLRRGKNPIEGASEFLKTLRNKKIPHFVLSNTTTISAEALRARLSAMGMNLNIDQILTANKSTIEYLKRNEISSVYLLGTDSQREEFEEQGIAVTQEGMTQVGAVVVSLDKQLTYEKLSTASTLIRKGADYIATNLDTNMITSNGSLPDVGATAAFLYATTGKEPSAVAGKPSNTMMDLAREATGVPPMRTAIIGDQLQIDIKMAHEYGMISVLVLSGLSTREDVANSTYKPDYVVDRIDNLIPLFS